MVPEAPIERTEQGLRPTRDGWFVVNARDVRWGRVEGRGRWPSLEGGRPIFQQLGVGLTVLEPGEPMGMYHWETDQEDFLVLAGEAVAIVEGEERPLLAWDFVHCPAGTRHVIVGAGDGPCVVFRVGSREQHTVALPDGTREGRPDWGAYTVDEAALRHGAGVEEETTLAEEAYARFPAPEYVRYEPGWLPG